MAQFLSKPFGMTPNGEKINEYIISNPGGLAVSVLNYGCIIKNIWVPTKSGLVDVVLGHDTYADYVKDFESSGSTCCGAFVGRYANRIENAVFNVGGKTYQLEANNGPNHLHGGIQGFDSKVWQVQEAGRNTLVLTLHSADGEENYPGNLEVVATYTVVEETLHLRLEAYADAATIVNLTNHAYWNLSGKPTIDSMTLEVRASAYTPVDATNIPDGRILPVEGTDFDLRKAALLGERNSAAHPDTAAEVIVRIPKDDEFTVLALCGTFALAEYAGTWGYVHRDFIQPVAVG